ncbi:hypothetical protein PUN28_006413 [Cardiocondyla obscurior]|uniref:Uncharacterized protein n=1 Tax=Cardiocondyla obscurior TaxID=286306 RepID=A0AAW2GB35_9HYME
MISERDYACWRLFFLLRRALTFFGNANFKVSRCSLTLLFGKPRCHLSRYHRTKGTVVIIAAHNTARPKLSAFTKYALPNPYKGVAELGTWSTSFPTALTSQVPVVDGRYSRGSNLIAHLVASGATYGGEELRKKEIWNQCQRAPSCRAHNPKRTQRSEKSRCEMENRKICRNTRRENTSSRDDDAREKKPKPSNNYTCSGLKQQKPDVRLFNMMFDRSFSTTKLDYQNDFVVTPIVSDSKTTRDYSVNSNDVIQSDELPDYVKVEHENEEDDLDN